MKTKFYFMFYEVVPELEDDLKGVLSTGYLIKEFEVKLTPVEVVKKMTERLEKEYNQKIMVKQFNNVT